MSKQDVRKLLDKQIGAQGLKISTSLSNGYNPSSKTVTSGSTRLTFPDSWDSRIGVNLTKKLGLIATVIDLNDIIREHITSLRWWGESYSYFNRKSDAVAFAEEYEFLVREQIFIPGVKQWQAAIPGHSPLPGWFIDPETLEPKQTQTNTRPLVVEHLTHLPGIKSIADLALPISSAAVVGAVDWEKYKNLNQSAQLAAARIIALALNISLLMTSYPDLKTAASSQESRPILVLVHGGESSDLLGLEFGLKLTSAELASIHKLNIPNLKFPFSTSDLNQLMGVLDRNDHRYIEYFTEVFNQSGIYNNLIVARSDGSQMAELWLPVEVAPEVKLEAELVAPSIPEPVEPEIEVVEEILVTEVEAEVHSQPPTQQPQIQQRVLGDDAADYQASITHRFDYNGSRCSITLTTDHTAKPTGIIISGHKLDFSTATYLSTISELASLALQTGASLTEIGDLLEGVVAGETNGEHASILDYCGKWLASYR